MSKPINLFEYENQAKEHLSPMALDYYRSGARDEITLKDNRTAFDRYRLLPRMMIDVSGRDSSTSIFGQTLPMPIAIAPMAFQCLAHPEGELATARACASLGIPMILSTLSTQSLESVAEERKQAPQWFQLYIHRDRALTRSLVERAEAAGYSALCLTVDAPVLGKREKDQRNQFTLPTDMQLANLASSTDLEIPKTAGESGLFAYFAQQIDPGLTWQDLAWLQSITTLPVIVKGILRPDDARLALEHGAKGIVVSNHGGRQLDSAVASLDALPEVVAAVGDQIDVLVDGGIRRGTDILKALALGAKGVLLGRPILWGLAVAGEAGVGHVLTLLQEELDIAMALSGCPRVLDIEPSLLVKGSC